MKDDFSYSERKILFPREWGTEISSCKLLTGLTLFAHRKKDLWSIKNIKCSSEAFSLVVCSLCIIPELELCGSQNLAITSQADTEFETNWEVL